MAELSSPRASKNKLFTHFFFLSFFPFTIWGILLPPTYLTKKYCESKELIQEYGEVPNIIEQVMEKYWEVLGSIGEYRKVMQSNKKQET